MRPGATPSVAAMAVAKMSTGEAHDSFVKRTADGRICSEASLVPFSASMLILTTTSAMGWLVSTSV